jgi:hypothetical protein
LFSRLSVVGRCYEWQVCRWGVAPLYDRVNSFESVVYVMPGFVNSSYERG